MNNVTSATYANKDRLSQIDKKKRQIQDLWDVGIHFPENQWDSMTSPRANSMPLDAKGIFRWLEERSNKQGSKREIDEPWSPLRCEEG